jgi:hypothetical protein
MAEVISVTTIDGESLLVGHTGVIEISAQAQSNVAADCDPSFLAQVSRCRAWFGQAGKVTPPSVNSFWLQQFLQHWSGERLCQGAVIVAASESDFAIAYERGSRTSSVLIGVSNDSISHFDCGCGHP